MGKNDFLSPKAVGQLYSAAAFGTGLMLLVAAYSSYYIGNLIHRNSTAPKKWFSACVGYRFVQSLIYCD